MRRILLALLLLAPGAVLAQQQAINCATATACGPAGPTGTNTGDPLWRAGSKINANEGQLYGMFGSSSHLKTAGSANSADIIGLWSGTCTLSNFLRGDGSCAIVPRPATLVVCAPDTIGQPAGCDVVTSGLLGAGGSRTGAEVALNSNIQSCGSGSTPTFTASIGPASTTMTVTAFASGSPIYVGMPVNGAGVSIISTSGVTQVTALGTGTGGTGTYTVSVSQTVSSEAMTGPQGACHMFLRNGTYETCGSIVVDRSFLDLEGETAPEWGGYAATWSTGGLIDPTGLGVKIHANTGCAGSVDGYDIIKNAVVNVPDNGENRHRGNRLAKLHIVGDGVASGNYVVNSNTPTGVNFSAASGLGGEDGDVFEYLMIQRVFTGFFGALDSPTVRHLNLQDDYNGFQLSTSELARVNDLLIYDIGNTAITASGWGHTFTNLSIGDAGAQSNGSAMVLSCEACSFTGGTISSVAGTAIAFGANKGIVVNGINIDYNQGQYTGKNRTGFPAVTFNASTTASEFSNAAIIPAGTESEAAVALGTAVGNTVTNLTITSGFSSGGANTITATSPASNTICLNQGDNTTCSVGALSATTLTATATGSSIKGLLTVTAPAAGTAVSITGSSDGTAPLTTTLGATGVNGLIANNNGTNDVGILSNSVTAGDAYFRANASGVQSWSMGTQRSTGSWVLSSAVGLGSGKLTLTQNGNFTFSQPSAAGTMAMQVPSIQSNGTQFTLGTGTGACATTSTLTGGQTVGSFKCTGVAGASTQVINFPTSTNGWACWASDVTSGVVWAQASTATSSAKISGTLTTAGDVVVFGCMGY